MANRWSHPHGKTSPEAVPFTWQPTRSASPGCVEPRGTDPDTLRERGRSQKAALSTGLRRDVRCHTEGRRWWTGVVADPVPRRTSTAKAASARTARTVVTLRGLQPAAMATRELVTAQWRPFVPSAKRARAALTRVNKRGVRWALRRVRCPVELAAQAATSQVQEVREPHIGTVAGTEPTVTIHWRRRSR